MEYVTDSDEDELVLPWPGQTFRPGSDFFLGLLGTPHGRGVTYLITQHERGLPGKDIESITVFTTEHSGLAMDEAYHLLFTLTG